MRVYVQRWIESEAGWGQRPDGLSIHFSEEQQIQYVLAVNADQPEEVPAVYERPSGGARWMNINEDILGEELTAMVLRGESIRIFQNSPEWLTEL